MTTRPVIYNGYQIGTAEVQIRDGNIIFENVILDELPDSLKEGTLTDVSVDDNERLMDCE